MTASKRRKFWFVISRERIRISVFFFTQAELDTAAQGLNLDTDFSSEHPGDSGTLVLAAVGHTEAPRLQPFAPLDQAQSKSPPAYPGHLVERDDEDTDAVELIQQRLKELGLHPTELERPEAPCGGWRLRDEHL
jgi:hypothetical protein